MIVPLTRIAYSPSTGIRLFGSTPKRQFLNIFGKKDAKKREEIIKNQDDFESDPESKIVILSQENSPDFRPFDVETDMGDFKVNQWKNNKVLKQNIESTYTSSKLVDNINETYLQLKGEKIEASHYKNINLYDLSFRFQLAKALQQRLGFDFNDYTLTRAHTLDDLYEELNTVIQTRWVSERNPNGIVLRPEDFSAPNVYLNQELTEEEQQEELKKLVEKAREATA